MHSHYENRVQDKKQQRKEKRKKDTRTQTTKEAANPGVRIWNKRSKIRKKIELQKGSCRKKKVAVHLNRFHFDLYFLTVFVL